MSNVIPIVFASDKNNIPYMYVTILSVLKNKHSTTNYNIFCLITSDIKSKDKKNFYKLVSKYTGTNINFIDMGTAFNNSYSAFKHITIPAYYRLKMPELFPNYNKIIYLDTDVIVLKDLTEYYNIDIENFYIAGVRTATPIIQRKETKKYYDNLGLYNVSSYINSGVTLWNLRKIREDNLIKDLYDYASKNLKVMDQDVINIVFKNKIKTLSLEYNLMVGQNYDLYQNTPQHAIYVNIYGKENIEKAIKNPVIIHYTCSDKPWNSSSKRLKQYWWQYAKNTPYHFGFRKNIFSISKNAYNIIIKFFGIKISLKLKTPQTLVAVERDRERE